MTVSAASITTGNHAQGKATWSWVSSNATRCELTNPSVTLTGSRLTGSAEISYASAGEVERTLSCTGPGNKDIATTPDNCGQLKGTISCAGLGNKDSATAALAVGIPPTVTLTVAPAQLGIGQSATWTWSSANATSCQFNGSSVSLAASGSEQTSYTTVGTVTRTLTCTGPGGNGSATATLTVSPAPAVDLSVSPASITPGQSATWTWTSSSAASCKFNDASASLAISGSEQKTYTAVGAVTRTLTCTGAGGSGSASATLTVGSAAAPTSSSPLALGEDADEGADLAGPDGITIGGASCLQQQVGGPASSEPELAAAASHAFAAPEEEGAAYAPVADRFAAYRVICLDEAGGSDSSGVELLVQDADAGPPQSPEPEISGLTAAQGANGLQDGSLIIMQDEAFTLDFAASGVSACTAGVAGAVAGTGTGESSQIAFTVDDWGDRVRLDFPAFHFQAGSFTFSLACQGAGGQAEREFDLTVRENPFNPKPPRPALLRVLLGGETGGFTSLTDGGHSFRQDEALRIRWEASNAEACHIDGLQQSFAPHETGRIEPHAFAADAGREYGFWCRGKGGVSAVQVFNLEVRAD